MQYFPIIVYICFYFIIYLLFLNETFFTIIILLLLLLALIIVALDEAFHYSVIMSFTVSYFHCFLHENVTRLLFY